MGGTVEELRLHLGAMRRLLSMGINLEELPYTTRAPSLLYGSPSLSIASH